MSFVRNMFSCRGKKKVCVALDILYYSHITTNVSTHHHRRLSCFLRFVFQCDNYEGYQRLVGGRPRKTLGRSSRHIILLDATTIYRITMVHTQQLFFCFAAGSERFETSAGALSDGKWVGRTGCNSLTPSV